MRTKKAGTAGDEGFVHGVLIEVDFQYMLLKAMRLTIDLGYMHPIVSNNWSTLFVHNKVFLAAIDQIFAQSFCSILTDACDECLVMRCRFNNTINTPFTISKIVLNV